VVWRGRNAPWPRRHGAGRARPADSRGAPWHDP